MNIARLAGADVVEIRVDLLSESERPAWLQLVLNKTLPVVVTNRAAWEGGRATEPEEIRIEVLVEAAASGAEYIDVELKAADLYKRAARPECESAKLIFSHHNFERPLNRNELEDVYQRMVSAGADICKIAMAAHSACDNAIVFETLQRLKERPLVLIAMGELGQCSRILAPKFGAYLTFASIGAGRESAPGQIDAATLCDLYQFRRISKSTKIYSIIGNRVAYSMSPAIHNAALLNADIDAVYVPTKVEDDIPGFIKSMVPFGFHGFSVTIPGKVEALKAMDHVEEVASKIGAMNTVVLRESGELWGYNTDWVAAISAIDDELSLSGRSLVGARVLCVGAGGTARSLAYGALHCGAREVVIANRTVEKAEALADEMGQGVRAMPLEPAALAKDTDFDVLMNTTSVGMHPNSSEMPITVEWLKAAKPLVFDAVYNPLRTKLLSAAAEMGCPCVSGIEMFVRQAVEQFRLWNPDVEPNVALMRQTVLDRLTP
jgi:3-dehydroquinate dehydratase / shikimate dehydrogenase